jgi:hypothetical protein
MNLPGAWQVLHLRRLLLSRPYFDRMPDQGMIEHGATAPGARPRATRGTDYAFVYLPTGAPVTIRMGRVTGAEVQAWWFNPRTGQVHLEGRYQNHFIHEFTPPGPQGQGNDWVLVLDDIDREFKPPGFRADDAAKALQGEPRQPYVIDPRAPR